MVSYFFAGAGFTLGVISMLFFCEVMVSLYKRFVFRLLYKRYLREIMPIYQEMASTMNVNVWMKKEEKKGNGKIDEPEVPI